MVRAKSGLPYVYPHGKKWRAEIWNPYFRKLVYIGVFRSTKEAYAQAQRAMRTLGRSYYQHVPRSSCRRGHVLVGKNVKVCRYKNGKTYRRCAICFQGTQAAYRARRRAQRQARAV